MSDIFFLESVSSFKGMLDQEIDGIYNANHHTDQQVSNKY